jgi:hypothetical protein
MNVGPSRNRYAFVIGAPKCGTSSLYSWLTAHPAVVGSQPKETFYFVDPDYPLRRQRHVQTHGPDGFERFFPGPHAVALRLEATTHSLYQETTPARVHELFPDARVIAILRDPADRVLSSFRYTGNNLGAIRNGLSFSRFVELILEGRHDEIRPYVRSDRRYRMLIQELSQSTYLPHLLRWRTVFRDSLRVMQFERIAADPAPEIRALAAWLDIDPGFYADFHFERKNDTRSIRWRGLQYLVRGLRSRIGRRAVFRIGRGPYNRLQQSSIHVEEADPAVMDTLSGYFAPLNRSLAAEFPVDLSLWRP